MPYRWQKGTLDAHAIFPTISGIFQHRDTQSAVLTYNISYDFVHGLTDKMNESMGTTYEEYVQRQCDKFEAIIEE